MKKIIAEIGQAHDGSLGILHSYIDAVAQTGVDAIKFQTHIAEAESSIYEPFRVNFSYEDKTRFDYWKRMEFSLDQWKEIKSHCDEVGLQFVSSPFSCAAVDLLEKVGVDSYKIGSGEVNNLLLLEKVCLTGKEVILSSGMSSFIELDKVIKFIKKFGNCYSILQCTTSYPTKPEDWGLNVIQELKGRYNVPVGFSDHSGKIYAGIAAATLGAEIIEVHVVFDKRMFGPDSSSSITIEELDQLSKGIRCIETSLLHKIDKNDNTKFYGLKSIFEKSLAVNKDLSKGHIISFEDLESKKPAGMGIPAADFEKILGESLIVSLEKNSFLQKDHFKDKK